MSAITWLHLSDLHFDYRAHNRWDASIVLKKLLEDLHELRERQSLRPNFIVISGDIAYQGKPADYALAQVFLDKLLEVTNLSKDRLFIVPGNHDLDLSKVTTETKDTIRSFNDRKTIEETIADDEIRSKILVKYEDYAEFINSYLGARLLFNNERYYYVSDLEHMDKKVVILGLNSAWAAHGSKDDRGKLALSEHQVEGALNKIQNGDLCIAVLHHPFHWMREFDSDICERLLSRRCLFILHGHLHRGGLLLKETPETRVMIVPAGACYKNREYRNGYNLVRYDIDQQQGTIFLRAWSDSGDGFWTIDSGTFRNVLNGEYTFSLQATLSGIPAVIDPIQEIESKFNRLTNRALSNITHLIPGLSTAIPREEVNRVEDQLEIGNSVLLIGEAGTGKSSVGSKLATAAMEKGKVALLLDVRSIGHIEDEDQLRHKLLLNEPLHSTIQEIGRSLGCRFIIDQLDNIIGSPLARILTNIAAELHGSEGVEIVVISRKREHHEALLLKKLNEAGFRELTSHPLTEPIVINVLRELGIQSPSDNLINLSRNLLNLSLIGKIKERNPTVDFSSLVQEIDLWDEYIKMLIARDEDIDGHEEAERMIAEGVRLATLGLNSEDRTFPLDYPITPQQRRLISWGIILSPNNNRIYRFQHERLQDYFYAWNATEKQFMPSAVLSEIPEHMTLNVLPLMESIYSQKNPKLHTIFLQEVYYE